MRMRTGRPSSAIAPCRQDGPRRSMSGFISFHAKRGLQGDTPESKVIARADKPDAEVRAGRARSIGQGDETRWGCRSLGSRPRRRPFPRGMVCLRGRASRSARVAVACDLFRLSGEHLRRQLGFAGALTFPAAVGPGMERRWPLQGGVAGGAPAAGPQRTRRSIRPGLIVAVFSAVRMRAEHGPVHHGAPLLRRREALLLDHPGDGRGSDLERARRDLRWPFGADRRRGSGYRGRRRPTRAARRPSEWRRRRLGGSFPAR